MITKIVLVSRVSPNKVFKIVQEVLKVFALESNAVIRKKKLRKILSSLSSLIISVGAVINFAKIRNKTQAASNFANY